MVGRAEAMKPEYEAWIAAEVSDPTGRCAETTLRMVEAFPELRRVRGHFDDPSIGSQPHWWCVDPAGEIVDPTVRQFPCWYAGHYEEHVGPEPTGKCMNCGGYTYAPRSTTCSEACDRELVAYLEGV